MWADAARGTEMRRNTHMVNRKITSKNCHNVCALFCASFALASLLICAAALDACAQGIPPRVQILQTIKPIEHAPVSQVERLRMDIVNATDAQGRLNANKVANPGPYWLPPDREPGRTIVGPFPGKGVYWLPDVRTPGNTRVGPPR
jgi:hypothetical protein